MVRSRRTRLDKLRSNSEYLQFQMQNANKKRTLRGDIIFNRDATPTNVTSGETSYSRTGFDNLATSSETSNRSTSGTLKLFGNFHFGKKHHFQANLVFKYGHNTYDYLHTQAEAEEIRSNVKENNYSQRANLRYLWNIDKKNTLSARLLLNNMISDADYSGNVSNTQNMRSTDGRLILSWQFNHGKWSTNLMPGIDVTDYHTKGNKKNSQVLPRLTASVQFQPHNKDFVYLEGVVRTAAPPVSWLSGAVQRVDPVEVRVGNPNLPQTKVYMGTVVYGIGLSKVNLQWYAVYLFQDDSPAYAYCIADDYLMRTMDARAGYHNFVTSLDASWRPTKNLNISAKVGYMYQRDCFPGEPTPTAKAVIYGAKAAYYIGNVAINAKYDSPTQYTSLGAREKTDHTYGISVSYAVGGWQMEVGANNLFLKPTTETWIQSNVYNGISETRNKKDMSHGYVRVAYSFDFGKKLKHTNDGPDRSSESAILRAN